MASHQIAIAKASLTAGLLRPDPTPVGRDEIAHFHKLLEQTLSHCSSANIQNCKEWLLDNILPSSSRITALSKYLTTLTATFSQINEQPNGSGRDRKTSIKRKRLHVFYLLNDLLHHTKYHSKTKPLHRTLANSIQPHLLPLFSSLGSFEHSRNAKFRSKIEELLNVWKGHGYYAHDYLDELQQTVNNANLEQHQGKESRDIHDHIDNGRNGVTKSQKEVPFLLPASHGDMNTPYYDLPAGNLLSHIIPNSSRPINPRLVKPLQFLAGPADESLISIVKDFLQDVSSIDEAYDALQDEGIVMDMDELGQQLVKDGLSDTLIAKEAYFGWSTEFCERMKKRKLGHPPSDLTEGDANFRSRSASFSPPRNSRMLGEHERTSRSRSPKQQVRQIGARRSRSRSPLFSNASRRRNSRSVSPRGPRHKSTSARPSRQPFQPATLEELPPYQPRDSHSKLLATPAEQIDNPIPQYPPPPLHPVQKQHQYPLDTNGLPLPPAPPYHSGPWPPSMPQMMPPMPPGPANFSHLEHQFPGLRGLIPPPPPPPLPPPNVWHGLAQSGGLASPMPLWNGNPSVGTDQSYPRTQNSDDAAGGTGSYQQSRDPRRR